MTPTQVLGELVEPTGLAQPRLQLRLPKRSGAHAKELLKVLPGRAVILFGSTTDRSKVLLLLQRHHALLAQLCAQHAPYDKGAGAG